MPHWEVEDGRYFVTIHLAGAIPPEGTRRVALLAQELNAHAESAAGSIAVARRVFSEMERWLDRATQNTLLGRPDVAEMVMEAIEHRSKSNTWEMHEFVIMPTHLHLFVSVRDGTLKPALEDFKRWTGHQAAKLVDLPGGRFWQDEWFDHWSRSDEQDENIVWYIRRNPEKAGLVTEFNDWPYGGWR